MECTTDESKSKRLLVLRVYSFQVCTHSSTDNLRNPKALVYAAVADHSEYFVFYA